MVDVCRPAVLWSRVLWIVDDQVYEIKEGGECRLKTSQCSDWQTHVSLPLSFSPLLCLSLSFRASLLSGFRSKSIPVLTAVLDLYICPPVPMDIYSAGFVDDSQDGELSREHSPRLIWVSGLSSQGGTKEGAKQIAFKAFNKSEYTFLTV